MAGEAIAMPCANRWEPQHEHRFAGAAAGSTALEHQFHSLDFTPSIHPLHFTVMRKPNLPWWEGCRLYQLMPRSFQRRGTAMASVTWPVSHPETSYLECFGVGCDLADVPIFLAAARWRLRHHRTFTRRPLPDLGDLRDVGLLL